MLFGAVSAPEARGQGWQADPKQMAELEKRNVGWIYDEAKVPEYQLPDPLLAADGTRITSTQQWEQKRRPETIELFRQHVYGRTPGRPQVRFEVLSVDEKAMDGRATRRTIRITAADGGNSYSFPFSLFTPNQAAGRSPCFVLINNRRVDSADPSRKEQADFWPAERIIERGYATAVFMTNDVDPDRNGDEARALGVRGALGSPGRTDEDAWATLGAWAWGASRVMDYLETDAKIDAGRVGLVGHSRGGKTALWAGAQDERFAISISNNSGCGGAALSRRRYGETVAAINRGFPYWFNGNFKKFNGREDELPVDQHQLIALIAPRAVYVASADADFWADQRGEFLAMAHAGPVYALYGQPTLRPDEMPGLESPLVRGRMGYHIRRGGHGLTRYDWERFMDFADQLWR
jgi:dienelactone hydrolase